MCLGSSKLSAPVQEDPRDNYYDGNVFDPKPFKGAPDRTSVDKPKETTSDVNLDSGLEIPTTTSGTGVNYSNTNY
jgi:hypothetical protein